MLFFSDYLSDLVGTTAIPEIINKLDQSFDTPIQNNRTEDTLMNDIGLAVKRR